MQMKMDGHFSNIQKLCSFAKLYYKSASMLLCSERQAFLITEEIKASMDSVSRGWQKETSTQTKFKDKKLGWIQRTK